MGREGAQGREEGEEGEEGGSPKVTELHLSSLSQKNVLWLHVSVQNAMAVQVAQSRHQLSGNGLHLERREGGREGGRSGEVATQSCHTYLALRKHLVVLKNLKQVSLSILRHHTHLHTCHHHNASSSPPLPSPPHLCLVLEPVVQLDDVRVLEAGHDADLPAQSRQLVRLLVHFGNELESNDLHACGTAAG